MSLGIQFSELQIYQGAWEREETKKKKKKKKEKKKIISANSIVGFPGSKTNYYGIPSSRLYSQDAGGPLLMIYIKAEMVHMWPLWKYI